MFEKVSQAAERLATGVSRRGFLDRLGKGALALAGVLGGVLAWSGPAQATPGAWVRCCARQKTACGSPPGGVVSCQWQCSGVTVWTVCSNNRCPVPASGCVLVDSCTCH